MRTAAIRSLFHLNRTLGGMSGSTISEGQTDKDNVLLPICLFDEVRNRV